MKNIKLTLLNRKKIIFSIFLIVLFVGFVCVPVGQAQPTDPDAVNYGLDRTANEGFNAYGGTPAQTDIPTIIGRIIGAVLSFIGILFFVLVIYGGYLWMTARGNEEQVGQAISIVTQATIGLIIVAAAYLITRFLGETIINQVIR
ncbi:MAG: hypothetical protein PHR36_00795 [Patescibacteria group bacterium]|nr:hypothetical protein [Patescibacteria group bacterium]